jgi:hypothetical protein
MDSTVSSDRVRSVKRRDLFTNKPKKARRFQRWECQLNSARLPPVSNYHPLRSRSPVT